MEDDELDKLRQQKKEEIQQSQEDQEKQQEQIENQVWARAKQCMTSDATERLSNIKIADKRKALAVAQQITKMVDAGRINKVDDSQMKQILKSIENEKQQNESDIKFRR